MRPLKYFSRLQTLQPMRPAPSQQKPISPSRRRKNHSILHFSPYSLYINLPFPIFFPFHIFFFFFFFFFYFSTHSRIRNHPPSPATIYGDGGNFSNFRISRLCPITIHANYNKNLRAIRMTGNRQSAKVPKGARVVHLLGFFVDYTSHEFHPFFAECPIDLRG